MSLCDIPLAPWRVAVLILNWNGRDFLRSYLPLVLRHTPKEFAKVIVVDNGSTDDSIDVVLNEFPEAGLIPLGKNYGFAEGYNRAISHIVYGTKVTERYKYSVLLNSDVEVKDDWLTPLYDFMMANPKVGAVQPKILSMLQPEKFEYAGASGGFLDRNGYPYCRGRIFGSVEDDQGQYDAPVQVDWASGAALMVDNDLYLSVGGLDSSFFAHMEEIDLCWRIRLAGRQVWAVPAGRVYHLGGGSLPASNPKKTYLNFRNNLLMLHKNLPRRRRGLRLVWRRLLDTLAWAKFVVCCDFKNAGAVVRAHRDFSRMKTDAASSPQTDLLAGRPNILWEYYLRGRRRYSDLKF